VFDIAERARSYGRPLDPDGLRAGGARLVDAERR
jgi:hypothetical protein